MQHDETRDNITAIEATIIEADSRYADGTPRDEPKAEPAQWIHYD
jgi:hypothetical protein